MLALSIRQPFAELILRGIKTVEYRSRPTRRVGERFWIYAAKKPAVVGEAGIWSKDLVVERPPGWLVELWEQARGIEAGGLWPTGVIVGSAVIKGVSRIDEKTFGWRIGEVKRARKLRKPQEHPQPVWFNPF